MLRLSWRPAANVVVCASALVLLAWSAGAGYSSAASDCNKFEQPRRQIEACTDYIRHARGLGPSLAAAYTNRAIAREAIGQHRQAMTDFEEAIGLAPDAAAPYYNRANALMDRGKLAAAIDDYTAAIARDDGFALAYLNRGIAYGRLGQRDLATDDLARAQALDPASGAQGRLERLRVPPGGQTAEPHRPH